MPHKFDPVKWENHLSLVTNGDKMRYTKQNICCRLGFAPAEDHSVLVCEGYRPKRKTPTMLSTERRRPFKVDEFLNWLEENR